MNYENFVKEIHGEFEMLAERKGLSGRVVIRDIVKNNNVHLKSISVVNDENRATPTIYLESYYEEFCQGKDISDIANEIFEMYIMNSCGLNFSMEDFMNYSYIKNKIAYKVINYDMNREMLKTVPHLHILDLAIVFNIVIEEDAYNSATAMIKKEHLDMWQVSKKEIEEVALTNTPELMPPVIMRMEDLLAEMIINDISMQWDDEDEQEQWDFVKEDCAYGGHPKEKVSEYVREEIEKMKRYGRIYTIMLIVTVVSAVPLFMWLGVWAFIPWGIIWAISMYFAFKVEKVKKDNDVQTYKEIVAFSEGKLLDDIHKQREIGKRPYQKILIVIGTALTTFVVCVLIGFLMHILLN